MSKGSGGGLPNVLPTTLAELGPPLAAGRTGTIYAWGTEQVVKLFLPGQDHPRAVQHEAENARQVYKTGLPVPAVGEIIEIEGRRGIIYERVVGVSLLRILLEKPWRCRWVMLQLAEQHAAMHHHTGGNLPAQHERLAGKIRQAAALPAAWRQQALDRLANLPRGETLCHGDFHPDNLIMTAKGPVLIDWVDATSGHPLADVARTWMLLHFAPNHVKPAQRWLVKGFFFWLERIYLRRYCQLRPFDAAALQQWLLPVLAARLAENISAEEPHLLAYLRRHCL